MNKDKFKINLNTVILQASHNREMNTNVREDTSVGILTRGHAGSGAAPPHTGSAVTQAGTLAGH